MLNVEQQIRLLIGDMVVGQLAMQARIRELEAEVARLKPEEKKESE